MRVRAAFEFIRLRLRCLAIRLNRWLASFFAKENRGALFVLIGIIMVAVATAIYAINPYPFGSTLGAAVVLVAAVLALAGAGVTIIGMCKDGM